MTNDLKAHLKSLAVPVGVLILLNLVGLGFDAVANDYFKVVVLYIFINMVAALSLNLVSGFTGQFSLGHAGFMAVGAYVSAYLSIHPNVFGMQIRFLPESLEFFNFPIYALFGGLAAAIAGYVVGLPSLRLKGDYLAIVTLGFGEIIRVILTNIDAVGGALGMYNVPGPRGEALGISDFSAQFFWHSFWVIVTFVTIWRLIHSAHGRAFLSVREDEIAAEAMGINTTKTKVRAFVLSSFFAGISGAALGQTMHYLSPGTFQFTKSVDVIIMVVLGGMGSLSGSLIAAIIVTVIPEWVLRPLQDLIHVDLRMVVYSLALIIFMILRPKGIFGRKEITQFWRRNGAKSSAS